MKMTIDGQVYDVTVSGDEVTVDDRSFRVRTEGRGPLKTVYVDEQPFRVEVPVDAGAADVRMLVDAQYREVHTDCGVRGPGSSPRATAARQAAPSRSSPASEPGGIPAAMAGRVLKIAVEPGQAVKSGELLLIFEAMKMENEIKAAHDGTVKEISVKVGDRVSAGDLLLVFT
jgi:biotin carboxyl carrier protein